MYPSRLQYQNAVVNEMFPYQENGGYTFRPVIGNGEPVVSSGGNAIVFKVADTEGDYYAVKLFTEEVLGRQNRLRSIAHFLDGYKSKYFTHFSYIDKLIYVAVPGLSDEQCYFPGIVMKWLSGKILEEKIREYIHSNQPKKISIIAQNFRDLCIEILNNNIAHGDLKLSNIMVDEDLNLFLIDYDGMFVPDLTGEKAIENGTHSYQHPLRNESHFNPGIDHFSIISIYYSLLAIADRPSLYSEYNDGDNIIFSKSDLEKPNESNLFQVLESEKIQPNLLYFLKRSLFSSDISIPLLHELLLGIYPEPTVTVTHDPVHLVEGQPFLLKWSSSAAEFLHINGEDHPLVGEKVFTASQKEKFELEFGYASIKKHLSYRIDIKSAPLIQLLEAQQSYLKEDEPLILKWKVNNAENILLLTNGTSNDVTGLDKIEFPPLNQNVSITLKAKAKDIEYYVERTILVQVCHPVSLNVQQDKKITISNQPILLTLNVANADSVLLIPGNVDLTGKESYALTSSEDMTFKIVASNRRYTESYSGKINVLKYPAYRESVIQIPELHLQIPEFFIKIPPFDFREEQHSSSKSIFEKLRSVFRNNSRINISIKRKIT
jgi:serine/threonine protein kinase